MISAVQCQRTRPIRLPEKKKRCELLLNHVQNATLTLVCIYMYTHAYVLGVYTLYLYFSERIVIVDSLNYIKGYRYELYCLSKHVKTTQCVLHCDISPDIGKSWNSVRDIDKEKYTDDVFDSLVMRYEVPNSQNRWDSPLFVIQHNDPLPAEEIMASLLHRKPPPPNLSTQSQPLSSADFLHTLDRMTQEIVSRILEAQRTAVSGDNLVISCGNGRNAKLRLPHLITIAELRHLRRQYINYTKLHPPDDVTLIPILFVQYINTSL